MFKFLKSLTCRRDVALENYFSIEYANEYRQLIDNHIPVTTSLIKTYLDENNDNIAGE